MKTCGLILNRRERIYSMISTKNSRKARTNSRHARVDTMSMISLSQSQKNAQIAIHARIVEMISGF